VTAAIPTAAATTVSTGTRAAPATAAAVASATAMRHRLMGRRVGAAGLAMTAGDLIGPGQAVRLRTPVRARLVAVGGDRPAPAMSATGGPAPAMSARGGAAEGACPGATGMAGAAERT
jgi:hypothetical protein